jgi:malate dehydrogenase
VPCIIGVNGIESIVDIKLNSEEQNRLNESAKKVQAMNAALNDIL